jgi:dolichyl-phosphate beta-glucosyltransferase
MTESSGPGTGPRRSTLPIIVVPCFNEVHRLDEGAFVDLAVSGGIQLLFVNDGSTDGTGALLERLAGSTPGIETFELPRNMGKAEAVRRGLRHAMAGGASIVGYLDADLATPGREVIRIVNILADRPELMAVWGSRVALLGTDIQRSAFRHYAGRIFATFASMALGVSVYDTQCGAKAFRVNEALVAAVEVPFRSRWSFDVLLMQRLLDGTPEVPGLPVRSFLETPLQRWSDVPGSKVDLKGSVNALFDVVAIGLDRHRNSRTRSDGGSPRPTTPGSDG